MIIVDMEMPKSCEECYLKGEMDLCRALTEYYNADSIPKDCPIKAEIPDNATNGDVIKAMFPNCALTCNIMGEEFICEFNGNKKKSIADREWWNAPYKSESEG